MSAPTRPTPSHQQNIEQQILTELQQLRRAVEQIAAAVQKLSADLPNAIRG